MSQQFCFAFGSTHIITDKWVTTLWAGLFASRTSCGRQWARWNSSQPDSGTFATTTSSCCWVNSPQRTRRWTWRIDRYSIYIWLPLCENFHWFFIIRYQQPFRMCAGNSCCRWNLPCFQVANCPWNVAQCGQIFVWKWRQILCWALLLFMLIYSCSRYLCSKILTVAKKYCDATHCDAGWIPRFKRYTQNFVVLMCLLLFMNLKIGLLNRSKSPLHLHVKFITGP